MFSLCMRGFSQGTLASSHVRSICESKLTLRVTVSVDGCLCLCGPVMDWRPVQGVPCLSPNGSKIG